MDPIPYLERVKIQSEILLPLFRRLRDEIGNERACALLRAAVLEYAEALGQSVAATPSGSSLDKLRTLMPIMAAGNALAIEPLVDNTEELSINVRRCEYASYFQALGEAEFGAMITCEIDPPMTTAIGTDLGLERTQTMMRGASHCDFRWRLAQPERS